MLCNGKSSGWHFFVFGAWSVSSYNYAFYSLNYREVILEKNDISTFESVVFVDNTIKSLSSSSIYTSSWVQNALCKQIDKTFNREVLCLMIRNLVSLCNDVETLSYKCDHGVPANAEFHLLRFHISANQTETNPKRRSEFCSYTFNPSFIIRRWYTHETVNP